MRYRGAWCRWLDWTWPNRTWMCCVSGLAAVLMGFAVVVLTFVRLWYYCCMNWSAWTSPRRRRSFRVDRFRCPGCVEWKEAKHLGYLKWAFFFKKCHQSISFVLAAESNSQRAGCSAADRNELLTFVHLSTEPASSPASTATVIACWSSLRRTHWTRSCWRRSWGHRSPFRCCHCDGRSIGSSTAARRRSILWRCLLWPVQA